MYNRNLGALEEFILLLILVMDKEVYSVTLAEEYYNQTKKSISLPAIHTVLRQLEKKNYVESSVGGSTSVRGGRSKRIYSLTTLGYNAIKEVQQERQRLWKLAPSFTD
ncbi:MAG: PadR family transcriptional regulator [Bacteroidota bacterium]